MESAEDGPSQPAAEPKQHMDRDVEMAIEHDRISWGGGSAPSLPSIDDDPQAVSHEDVVCKVHKS
ncbi:hypothetical protein RRF57_006690 [Xylaria bambusicola]|uniref:Uncharacterized protein n=1 Tax=Xylaria bambusicola TaxID=326684 RepID=A0AAN7UES6_9PEZI